MRRILILVPLALLCLISSSWPQATSEKDTSREVSADAVRVLLAAKTVLVRGGKTRVVQTGKNTLLVYPTRKAEQALKKKLVNWGRFQVVDDAAKADLILVISEDTTESSRMERISERLEILPGGGKSGAESTTPLWQVEEVGPAFGFNRRPTDKLIEHLQKDLAEFEKSAPPAAAR